MNRIFRQRIVSLQTNLLNFAIQLTSNREDARDLLQETTLKALDNEDKYVDNVNFKGWIFTIMRNLFINNYRKQVRQNTVVDQTGSVLSSFSYDYRVPFVMHVEGYKYSEISEHMGLPIGTVKSRIFFARKRLQRILSDYR